MTFINQKLIKEKLSKEFEKLMHLNKTELKQEFDFAEGMLTPKFYGVLKKFI